MKRLLYLPLLVILFFAGAAIWLYSMFQPVSVTQKYVNFTIDKGLSGSEIGNELEKAGLIRSAIAFKIYIQFSGLSNKMQTGEFRLSPGFNLFETVSTLLKGPLEVWVTIPEGYRREEIATKFASALDKDNNFVSQFMDLTQGKEGMLFPDTYLFPKDASASAIVSKMLTNFSVKTANYKAANGLSFNDRLILASLIERETKTDAERPIVAGILINRINAGMPLQVDASVQYAIATSRCKFSILNCQWWEPPTKADLEIGSSYNTYKFLGLPPAPISNPGLSSLNGAFSPAQTDYYYYIHDNSGQIHYASTLEEQNANISKYLMQ